MPVVILRRLEAARRVGLKPSAFDELRKRPDFCKPILITGKTPGFIESEIDSWIAKRIAERDGKETQS